VGMAGAAGVLLERLEANGVLRAVVEPYGEAAELYGFKPAGPVYVLVEGVVARLPEVVATLVEPGVEADG